MNDVVTPAATERITWLAVTASAISASTADMSCGFTATITSAAPCTASTFDVPAPTA